jgi:hypothetical protein
LVTDDEDFFDNLLDCLYGNLMAVIPVPSTQLLLHLWECGAITAEVLEAVLQAEEARIGRDGLMGTEARSRRMSILNQIADRLGLATPGQEGGH